MAVIKRWKIGDRAIDAHTSEEVADLERRIDLLQNHACATNKVGTKKASSYIIFDIYAKGNFTRLETSGNYLKFNSEGRNGQGVHLQVSCEFGADHLPRYDVRINGHRYKIVPRK